MEERRGAVEPEAERLRMHDQEAGLPAEDDLLLSEPHADETDRKSTLSGEEMAAEPGPRNPWRQLPWIGWTLVAVVAVSAVLIFAELFRISSELNRATCVARAQAAYAAGTGTGATPQGAALARLSLNLALNRCGR